MTSERHQRRDADRRATIDADRRRRIDFYRERGFSTDRIARVLGVPVEDVEAHIAAAPV